MFQVMGNELYRQSLSVESIDKNVQVDELNIKLDDSIAFLMKPNNYTFKQYLTLFSVEAKVNFSSLNEKEKWRVGFVQGCSKVNNVSYYENDAKTIYSIPNLHKKRLPLVLDSDFGHYPWYNVNDNGTVIIKSGNTKNYVHMYDHPHTVYIWTILKQYNIYKACIEEQFYTWLIAMNLQTYEYIILKTIKWGFNASYDINANKKQSILKFLELNKPLFISNFRIPDCTLYPVAAILNARLEWQINNNEPKVLISAQNISVENFDSSEAQDTLNYESD